MEFFLGLLHYLVLAGDEALDFLFVELEVEDMVNHLFHYNLKVVFEDKQVTVYLLR